MKKCSLIWILIFSSCVAITQNLTFYGLLPALNHTVRISNKVNYNLFVSSTIDGLNEKINNVEYPASAMQYYLQQSVIFIHSPKLNFAGSYTFQINHSFNSNYTNEHRLWQQSIFSLPISKGRMTNRLRLEERFMENISNGSHPFATRVRYQIGFNIPLQGRTLDQQEFYFNSYQEFYCSLTGAKNSTYSENWTYAGFGYDFGKMGRIELGYLLQVAVRNAQQDLRFLHLAQIMWLTNINLPKKN